MNNITLKDLLIAEDDIDDLNIFEMALKEVNVPYHLRHAENGDMLFVLLKDRLPYLLFLDINMPCKDGVSCIVEIRKNREYDNLPIVVYSANLYQKIIEECFRNGANVYITKAHTFTSLTEKLQKVFAIDWDDAMQYPPQSQFILS
jgi:CheY-like chemotaxis protein